jgi:hypothetical protein
MAGDLSALKGCHQQESPTQNCRANQEAAPLAALVRQQT